MAEYFEREKIHSSGSLLCDTLVQDENFLFALNKVLG